MYRFVPQITSKNIYKSKNEIETIDFLLNSKIDIDSEILLYDNNIPRMEFLDKNNCIEILDIPIFNKCFDKNYYLYEPKNISDTLLACFLYTTLAKFTILSPNEQTEYIKTFKKQMGINLDEKNLYKKLELSKHKIKKMELQNRLFNNDDTDNDYSFLNYLVKMFKINILILSSDSFSLIKYPNIPRKTIILLKIDNRYRLLNNKNCDINIFDKTLVNNIVKHYLNTIVNLKDAYYYKIDDLKQLSKKFNISLNGKTKKNEIYNIIKSFFTE